MLQNQSITDKLKARKEEEDKKKRLNEQELKELQEIAIKLFSTQEGKIFQKMIRKYCQIDVIDFTLEPQILAYKQALKNVYLTFFEVLLTKEKE